MPLASKRLRVLCVGIVEHMKLLFELGKLVLKVKQESVIQALKFAVDWLDTGGFGAVVRKLCSKSLIACDWNLLGARYGLLLHVLRGRGLKGFDGV